MDVDVLRRVFDRHSTARQGGAEAVITSHVLEKRLSEIGAAGVSVHGCLSVDSTLSSQLSTFAWHAQCVSDCKREHVRVSASLTFEHNDPSSSVGGRAARQRMHMQLVLQSFLARTTRPLDTLTRCQHSCLSRRTAPSFTHLSSSCSSRSTFHFCFAPSCPTAPLPPTVHARKQHEPRARCHARHCCVKLPAIHTSTRTAGHVRGHSDVAGISESA